MGLAENDDMIQALAAGRPDQPFGKAILPRPDHIARSPIPRKCLRDLTGNPFRRWLLCDVDPDEVSAVDPNDDECIEEVKTDRRDDEEVHGGNLRRVVAQEGPPSLAGWLPSFHHVLGDTRLRDLKAELEQFAVDARRAPKWIV